MFKSGSILGFEWFWPIPIVGFLMSLFALLSTCWGDHHRFTLLGAWFLRPDLPFLEELSFQPQGIPCNPKNRWQWLAERGQKQNQERRWCNGAVPLKDWTKIEQMGSQKKKLKNMDETVPVIPVLGIQKASILALEIQGTSSSASSGLSSSKKPAVGLSQWVQNSPFAPSKCSNNQHSWVGNGV